eukprot:2513009-Lingulodinium_polyedra.AAC.1
MGGASCSGGPRPGLPSRGRPLLGRQLGHRQILRRQRAFHGAPLHAIFGAELCRVACGARRMDWIAVRRRFKQAVDRAAAAGCEAVARVARIF